MEFGPISSAEVPEVCKLVEKVFMQFEAPEYSAEGIIEFMKYIRPEAVRERQLGGLHFILRCRADGKIVGVIEVRNLDHVCLLFVDADYQRKGIARRLWQDALRKCLDRVPSLTQVSVNSSPYAISVYEKLGFKAVKEEQVVNGIRFTPMVIDIREKV